MIAFTIVAVIGNDILAVQMSRRTLRYDILGNHVHRERYTGIRSILLRWAPQYWHRLRGLHESHAPQYQSLKVQLARDARLRAQCMLLWCAPCRHREIHRDSEGKTIYLDAARVASRVFTAYCEDIISTHSSFRVIAHSNELIGRKEIDGERCRRDLAKDLIGVIRKEKEGRSWYETESI